MADALPRRYAKIPIAATLPIPNSKRYAAEARRDCEIARGRRTITAAVPANPCVAPIMNIECL